MRTWLAIPALALACAALAVVAGAAPAAAAAIGMLGAALAAAVRAFAGVSIAATVAAATGALLAALAFVGASDHTAAGALAGASIVRAALAGACALFAIAELARPSPPRVAESASTSWSARVASPWPAFGAAALAAALDPSFIALPAIAGARIVVGPWSRPRWAIALPIAGVLAVAFAIVAAYALPELWAAWSGATAPSGSDLATVAGDALGPLAIIAAACGLAGCAAASRFAAAAVAAVALGAALVSVRDAALAPALPIAAALACGVAVARLAALVRLPIGQTFVGIAASFLLLASSSPLASWR